MVRGRDERGSSGCLWFVFPGEMPSKGECLFLNEGIMTSRERFVLGAPEQALGHVGPELGHSCLAHVGGPAAIAFLWGIWLHAGYLGRGGCRIFYFSPCFLSFSSLFSAKANFMIHVKNILISGHY